MKRLQPFDGETEFKNQCKKLVNNFFPNKTYSSIYLVENMLM